MACWKYRTRHSRKGKSRSARRVHSFFVGDEHRDPRSIRAVIKNLFGRVIVRVKSYFRLEKQLARALVEIVAEDFSRRGETGERIKRFAVFAFAGKSAGGAESGQRDLAVGHPVQLELLHGAVRVLQVNRDQALADGADRFEFIF